MTYIQPNILLTPTEKFIKPYECSFIVIEGPNMKSKLSLEGLQIKYESFYLSQLVLNQNSKDQPLIYGFLGENVTFIMIRAKYLPLDPNWALETDQYIQYYYSDDPTRIRTMSQLLVLTGNSTNRIPQIYFNNPSNLYKVYLEVLMGNLAQSDLTSTANQYTPTGTFNGLYYNSIITDAIYYSYPASTGSTELRILDHDGKVVMVIPYINIRTITKIDANTLLIGLDTEEKVKLVFLTEFNTDQAYSRINWVLENTQNSILTSTSPYMDITAPIITLNTGLTTGYTYLPCGDCITGDTYSQVYLYTLSSGQTLTPTNLIDYFINNVVDAVDGQISKYNVQMTIRLLNSIVPVTGVTESGIYNILFEVKDFAANTSSIQLYLYITGIAPSIIFKPSYTGMTLTLALNDYSRNVLSGNTIRSLTVDSVYDEVDTELTIGDIVMSNYGLSGFTIETTGITSGLTYTLTNNGDLTTVVTKALIVTLPEIVFNNVFYSGSTFDLTLSDYSGIISSVDIMNITVSGVTDLLDSSISFSNMAIVPTFITTTGTHEIIYTIIDSKGSHNTYIKTLNVI